MKSDTVKVPVGRGEIELRQGDITRVEVDAIVNAANEGLRGGGGVDGAIHRAGGPAIMAECVRIGGCPTGQAVVTTAGNLPARWVIHTVGPVWHDGSRGEPALLASAYLESLARAEEKRAASVAFPSISTGVYGYPIRDAAGIALCAGIEHLKSEKSGASVTRIVYVQYSGGDFEIYQKALEALAP